MVSLTCCLSAWFTLHTLGTEAKVFDAAAATVAENGATCLQPGPATQFTANPMECESLERRAVACKMESDFREDACAGKVNLRVFIFCCGCAFGIGVVACYIFMSIPSDEANSEVETSDNLKTSSPSRPKQAVRPRPLKAAGTATSPERTAPVGAATEERSRKFADAPSDASSSSLSQMGEEQMREEQELRNQNVRDAIRLQSEISAPETKGRQRWYETRCGELLTSIRRNLEYAEGGQSLDLLKLAVVELKNLFVQLDKEFESNATRLTAMTLCCNKILEVEGLYLLQAVQEAFPEFKHLTSFTIEKVVPHIWSI